MTTSTSTVDILAALSKNHVRNELVKELEGIRNSGRGLTTTQLGAILGQWFHPLHYFPMFLSRLISVAPTIDAQVHISRILWQELGEGEPLNAHEKIFIETMEYAGFARSIVAESAPFDATMELVEGYESSSRSYLTGLGFLYGTEVSDLPMVSTIGELIVRVTGKRDLPWVDIHIQQEPDHVESSNRMLEPSFADQDQDQILESAEWMWSLWINFFKALKREVF